MGNRYKVLLPLEVHTADASYSQGEEFEAELSEEEETAKLDSGLLEIVPSEYKVVGESFVFETAPGSTFTAALRTGQESLLTQGGHIERVSQTKPAKASKKKEEE